MSGSTLRICPVSVTRGIVATIILLLEIQIQCFIFFFLLTFNFIFKLYLNTMYYQRHFVIYVSGIMCTNNILYIQCTRIACHYQTFCHHLKIQIYINLKIHLTMSVNSPIQLLLSVK